jgi:hypothetical protein
MNPITTSANGAPYTSPGEILGKTPDHEQSAENRDP